MPIYVIMVRSYFDDKWLQITYERWFYDIRTIEGYAFYVI